MKDGSDFENIEIEMTENSGKSSQPPQKGFVQNVGQAFSGFFSKESPKHFQHILEDSSAPAYQKNIAIQGILLKKIKTLNKTLIALVKGEYGATSDVKVNSANALAKLGGFYSLDIPSVLLIDIMEIYMSTAEIKLSEALHNLFLSSDIFPYYKFAAKTLSSRFLLAGEVNAMVWEVYSRILHLCFDFRYREVEPDLKNDLKKLGVNSDKQRTKIEQSMYYVKRLIGIAEEVRDSLCSYLEKEPDMAQTIEFMKYPSLTASYHEKCKFHKLLDPIMEGMLSDRPGIRSLVMDELHDLKTPVAYDFYRSVILKEPQPFPDVPEHLIPMLANLSCFDGSALDIFVSFMSTPPSLYLDLYFEELEKLCIQNSEIHAKVISMAKGFVKRGDCPDISLQEIISRIFPIDISKETLDLLINMALGRVKISVHTSAKAARVLVQMNTSSFEFSDDVFKALEIIMTHSAPKEIKENIFREIKKHPTSPNMACLAKAVFDVDKEVAKIALKSYLEIVKTGSVEPGIFRDFFLSVGESELFPIESTVTVIDFLKNYDHLDDVLKKAVSRYFYSDTNEIRNSAFSTYQLWFVSAGTEAEHSAFVSFFVNILSDPSYVWSDTYRRVATILAEFLSAQDQDVSAYGEDIFLKIKSALESDISDDSKTILCDFIEFVAENAAPKVRIQAEWIMDMLIKNPQTSEPVALAILKIMVMKQGLLIQCTQQVIRMLSASSIKTKIAVLELLVSGMAMMPRYSYAEKLEAWNMRQPKELYEFVQWEIMINREVTPQLLSFLRQDFSNQSLMDMTLSAIKRIDYARKFAGFLFEFKDYPSNEVIKHRAIEAVSYLLYPEFSISEQKILKELGEMAADKSLLNPVRSAAMKAISRICDISQFELLTNIASDNSEKDEIRIMAVKAVNSFNTFVVNQLYALILLEPKTSVHLKEVILEGIVAFADSRVIEAVLTLWSESPNTQIAKLCKNLLIESGYGEIAEIHELYNKIQRLKDDHNAFYLRSVAAAEKLESFPEQTKAFTQEINEVLSALEACESSIAKETETINYDTAQWESTKNHITARIREVLPNWPAETRPPADKKAVFMDYQEQLREEKDNYDLRLDGCNKRLEAKKREKERLSAALSEIESRIEAVKMEENDLKAVIDEFNAETPRVEKQIEAITFEAASREENFMKIIPSLDRENHKRLIAAFELREDEWNIRRTYYLAIEKNMPESM